MAGSPVGSIHGLAANSMVNGGMPLAALWLVVVVWSSHPMAALMLLLLLLLLLLLNLELYKGWRRQYLD
jgi:hypothetical protein